MRWSRWVQAGLTGVGALGASSLALAPGTSLPGAAHAQDVVELLPEEPVPPGYATQSMFVICNPESILSERAVPGPLYSIFVPICCPIRVQKNVRSVRTHFRSTVRVWRKVVHLAPNWKITEHQYIGRFGVGSIVRRESVTLQIRRVMK